MELTGQEALDLMEDGKDAYEDIADGIRGVIDDYGWGAENLDALLGELPDWAQDALDLLGVSTEVISPLVFDLDNDGIELTNLTGQNAVFWDIDIDGFAEKSGWITGGDGLLAIDLNSDGIINDHSELFGDQTGFSNGFDALAAYDSNSDGLITSADVDFTDLIIWVDGGDAISVNTELYTLSQLGITSIDLGYTNVNYTIEDNEIRQESSFTINGQQNLLVDAYFQYNDVITRYTRNQNVDNQTFFLPTLSGFGNLKDLHVEMSLNQTLLDMVQDISVQNTETLLSGAYDLNTKMNDVLFLWAGVDAVDPASRGTHIDARVLEFMEVFTGQPWKNGSNPGSNQADLIVEAYETVRSAYISHIFAQTDAIKLLDEGAYYDPVSGELVGSDTPDFIEFSDTGFNRYYNNSGNNILVWEPGDGNDQIFESGGTDKIILSGVNLSQIRLENDASGNFRDLIIHVGNETILVDKHFDYDWKDDEQFIGDQVEWLILDDGTKISLLNNLTFTGTDTNNRVDGTKSENSTDTLIGLAGNDSLYGYGGNDILEGGLDNDDLIGGAGDDKYVWSVGDGNDEIFESDGVDTLILHNVIRDDIRIENDKDGNFRDLVIYINGEVITVDKHFSYDWTGYQQYLGDTIEWIELDDGTKIDLLNNLTFTGTNNSERIDGTKSENSTDTLIGLDGNDSLYGYDGDDTLEGGLGDDDLIGGQGDDTYIWSLGDGEDEISETGGDDNIKLHNVSLEDVEFFRISSRDLGLKINGAVITIEDHLYSQEFEVEKLILDSGKQFKILSDIENGSNSDDTSLRGDSNDNLIFALAGNDDARGKAGNDIVYGNEGDDRLEGDAGNDILNGGDGEDALRGDEGDDLLHGGDGDDELRGYDGNDILFAGAGADILRGYADADQFILSGADAFDGNLNRITDFNTSEGDTISLIDGLLDYDPLTDLISEFVTITESSSHTYINVDRDGSNSVHNSYQAIRIDNQTGEWTNINDAITKGDVIIS